MSNAPARVTVIYRVRITKEFFLCPLTHKPLSSKRTYFAKKQYKRLSSAQKLAADINLQNSYTDDGQLICCYKADVISHTASTPLH